LPVPDIMWMPGVRDKRSTSGGIAREHHRIQARICPIAAAVAANVIEFTRHKLPKEVAENFEWYAVMNHLLRRLTENREKGHYHCFRPWVKGFWDRVGDIDETHILGICEKLEAISIYHS
jgi:hypothetical protein